MVRLLEFETAGPCQTAQIFAVVLFLLELQALQAGRTWQEVHPGLKADPPLIDYTIAWGLAGTNSAVDAARMSPKIRSPRVTVTVGSTPCSASRLTTAVTVCPCPWSRLRPALARLRVQHLLAHTNLYGTSRV